MRSIIVALSKNEDSIKLGRMLKRHGLEPDMICKDAGEVLLSTSERDSGVVIASHRFPDMSCSEFYEYLPGYFDMIVISPRSNLEVPQGVVQMESPFKITDLVDSVETLLANQSRKLKKKKATSNIRTNDERVILDKAKSVLMVRNEMTEPEAYRYIQKCSMDSATSLVETAEMILLLAT